MTEQEAKRTAELRALILTREEDLAGLYSAPALAAADLPGSNGNGRGPVEAAGLSIEDEVAAIAARLWSGAEAETSVSASKNGAWLDVRLILDARCKCLGIECWSCENGSLADC